MQRAADDMMPLREARSFAILLEERPEDALFLGREALRGALQQHADTVIALPPPSTQQIQKWSTILLPFPTPILPKTLLSIAKTDCPIASVHYDETDTEVSIVITPTRELLRKEHIVVTALLPKPDIVIAFVREANLPPRHLSQLTLPTTDRIYLLGVAESAALAAYNLLLTAFPESLNAPGVATLFLASLLSETKNLTQKRSQELFSMSAELLGRGADINVVESLFVTPVAQTQLLGRALARTTVDISLASSWTFLAQKDFEKTGASPAPNLLRDILSEIAQHCKPQQCAFLLWQEKDGVRAMVHTPQEELRNTLASSLTPASVYPDLITFPWANFSEAEKTIRQALRQEQHAQQKTRQSQDIMLSS